MAMYPPDPPQPPIAWSVMPPFDWRVLKSKTQLHRELLDRMRYGQSENFRIVCDESRRTLMLRNTPECRAAERRRELEARWEDDFRMSIYLNESHETEAYPLAFPVQQPQQQHQLPAPEQPAPQQQQQHQLPEPQQPAPQPQLQHQLPAPQQPAPQPQQLPPPEVERQATPPPPEFEAPGTPPPPEDRQATPSPHEPHRQATPPPPQPEPEPQATTSVAARKRRHSASPAQSPRRSGSAATNASDVSAADTNDRPEQPSSRRRQRKSKPGVPADTDDIEGRNLPPAPPTIVKQSYVLVGQRLAAADQEQVIRRDTFKAVRYGNGIVVAQGELEGVSLPAPDHPERNWGIVYNDPEDPITAMAAGDAFLVMLSLKGHIFTVGRNTEGQLGAGRRPGVHRQKLTPTSMRRTVIRKKKLPSGKTKSEHAIFERLRCDGNVSTATTVDNVMYHWGDVFGPVMRC